MSQRKISSYFLTKQDKSASKRNELNLTDIKQEPPAEFLCVLPAFNHDRTLFGDFKVKTEKEKQKTSQPKFECTVCSKKFSVKSNLHRHLKSHEPQHQCNLCNKKIKNKRTYDSHLKLHKDPDAFNCDICHEKFLEKTKLRKHLFADHIHKVYKCRHCANNHKLEDASIPHVIKKWCACKFEPIKYLTKFL